MARNQVTKSPQASRDPSTGVVLTMTAADPVNFEQYTWTGKEVLVIQNTHATTTYTYTIHSVADERGRTGDITAVNIVAGAIHVIGPLSQTGWAQTNGNVNIDANNASVKWGVYTLL